MTDEDEYRFYPEDFDDEGELIEENGEFDPAPLVIVGSLGVGIALFIGDTVVDPVTVLGTAVELRSLSALVFSVGLFAGSGVYLRQRRRLLGSVHVLGGIGWVLLAFGAIRSNDTLLAAGAGTLIAGAVTLVVLLWRSSV